MKQLWKWIAKVMFYVVSVGLFVYAASRSVDFITATLTPDQRIVGFLGLLASGGGALAWLVVFLHCAQGTGKKGLAILFVVINLLGEFALFMFDTLYRSSEAGMIAQLSPDEIRLVVLGLSALIALNIAASFAFHLLDSETSRRMKEESAKDVLDSAVLAEIEKKAPALAERMTPNIQRARNNSPSKKSAKFTPGNVDTVNRNSRRPVAQHAIAAMDTGKKPMNYARPNGKSYVGDDTDTLSVSVIPHVGLVTGLYKSADRLRNCYMKHLCYKRNKTIKKTRNYSSTEYAS